uniref:Uncharacterized protein n=1 Tax=Plectus sambesii TaxID=2011161 RepID=A0A914X6I8_9BILA
MRDQKPIKATRTLHDFWNTPASSSSATTSGTTAVSGLANASKVQQSNSHQQHAPVFPARVQPSIKNIDSGDTVHLSDDDDDLLLAHAIKLESLQKKRNKPATAEEWQEFLPGFDVEAGQYWLYPKNKPKREYQYAIVRTALFHNTLV